MINYKIVNDLKKLGIVSGDILIVHSSLKSLGELEGGAETIIQSLLKVLGNEGTLLMPALSYLQNPRDFHDTLKTPTCVGYITEYFRKRNGTMRSLHPTHSVCAIGKRAEELLGNHFKDNTPCGPNSPFNLVADNHGKILMMGCGLKPNTSMHAFEEYIEPEYLFGDNCQYTIIDPDGRELKKIYHTHSFKNWEQRYDRIEDILDQPDIVKGKVLQAECYIIDSFRLRQKAVDFMREHPFFFVDKIKNI